MFRGCTGPSGELLVMKVFVSWSGKRSKAVAEILSDWVKCVIQATAPWISTRDIDRGALWFSEIGDQLQDTTVGIICLTQENKNRPWILFEAGALAKGLSSSRVCTFLIDLEPSQLQDPLAQFNHTRPDHDGVYNLVRTLNSTLGASRLPDKILDQIFETYWPQFEQGFSKALEDNPADEKPEVRSDESLLAEILENTRYLNLKVRDLESKLRKEPVISPASATASEANSTYARRAREAREWLERGELMELSSGKRYFVVRAQDTPSSRVQSIMRGTVRDLFGADVEIVYEGVPSE